MTTPASAEPTAEQHAAARELVLDWGPEDGYGYLATLIARALAAAVIAEREKVQAGYLEVAKEYQDTAALCRRAAAAEDKQYRREELEAAALDYESQARRIREVSR